MTPEKSDSAVTVYELSLICLELFVVTRVIRHYVICLAGDRIGSDVIV